MGGRINTMALSKEQLAEIIGRVDKASKGPWEDCYKKGKLKNYVVGPLNQEKGVLGWPITCSGLTNVYDAEFIAHSREDVPELLNDLHSLRQRLKEIEWEVRRGETEMEYNCTACNGDRFSGGHKLDCWLSAEIKKL